MKKVLSIFGLLFFALESFAQTVPDSNQNYVFSTTCLTADCVKKTEIIQYSDGLGRPKQTINVKASPSGKDVVTHIEYDALGRQIRDYLPVPQTGTSHGSIYASPLSNASSTAIYGNEKIYSEKVIENSPLGRLQLQTQPGNDWEGNPVIYEYKTNIANEVLRFTTVTGTQNGAGYTQSLTINGYYPASNLYKNLVADEDGNTTTEYKNAQGQTLLIRKRVGEALDAQGIVAVPPANMVNVDTYYVYNEYNQLAFVITPMASKELRTNSNQTISNPAGNNIIKELCYQYRYDDKARLVEKKLPGKGWEYLVYDKQDRLIMTQDANLGTSGQWVFNKFDQYGRQAYSGLCNPGAGSRTSNNLLPDAYRHAQQTNADAAGNNNVSRTTGFTTNLSGIKILYAATGTYPADTAITQMLSLNYYDTYPTQDDNFVAGGTALPERPNMILDQKTLSDDAINQKISTKGLPVASYINIIDQQQWTKTFIWYDELGREIGAHTINHLGGSTVTRSALDFTGAVQKTETLHRKIASEAPIQIVEDFEYDDQKRLLKHYHEVMGRTPKELLTENHYNEKDQLDSKQVGALSDENFTAVSPALQQVVYDYNIRNWLTGINLDQNDSSRPLDPTRLFSYKIKYIDPDSGLAKYNGNIAEIDWTSESDEYNRYVYTYDAMSRLLRADFKTINTTGTSDSDYYNEWLSYDLNGNIKTLKRNAASRTGGLHAIQIDNLKYYYEQNNLSNKLWKITDNEGFVPNPSGYPGGGGTITYDGNGNMLTMPDKGITQPIQYNHLDLPKQMVQNGNPVAYTYRADGTKVRKQFTFDGQNIETDYLDGFVYTTPYTGKMEAALLDNPEVTSAKQPDAFELAEKVVVDPGGPVRVVSSPNFFPTAEGFYDYENSRYIYQYTDHLGNVRLSFTRSQTGSAEALSTNDYYPFGLNFINVGGKIAPPQYNPSVSFENWKYNGKELEETGMYDYGARFYMPDLGRFGMIDPRSQYTHESYSYVWNNPINFWDPTGMEGESASSDSGGSGGAEATNGGGGEEGGFGGLAQGGPGKGKGGNPEKEKVTLIEEVVITVYKPIKVAATAAVSFTVTTSEAIFASVSSAINSAGASLAVGLRWSLLTLPLILNGDTPRPENDIFIPPPPYYKSDKDDDKDSNGVEVPKEGSSASSASPDPLDPKGKDGIGSRNAKKGDKMGSNQRANKMVDDVAKKNNINRREFGKYVERTKKSSGQKGADNYSWRQLEDLARKFKSK